MSSRHGLMGTEKLSPRAARLSRDPRRAADSIALACERGMVGGLETLERRVMLAVDPVIVFAFEDPASGTAVEDTSTEGSDNDGTIVTVDDLPPIFMPASGTGADAPSPAGGQFMRFQGDSLFNGAGGRVDTQDFLGGIDATNNTQGPLGRSATLAFWIRTTSVGGGASWQWPGVTGNEHQGDGDDIVWGAQSTDGRNVVDASGGGALSTTVDPINTGEWFHVVHTRDHITGRESTYLNGVLRESVQDDPGEKRANFKSIGAIANVGGLRRIDDYAHFNGDLDKVEIYDRPLPPSEVLARYGPTGGTAPAAPTGLTATATGANTIDLSFTDNSTNEGAFEVIQSRTNNIAAGTVVASLPATDATGTVLNVTAGNLFPGTQYFFFVRAVNGAGASAPATANATTAAPRTAEVPAGTGAYAEYFTNYTVGQNLPNIFGDPALTRVDPRIAFDFGGGSPGPEISTDNHVARWTGKLAVPNDFDGDGIAGETFPVRFVSATDDGAFMWINGETVIFDQTYHGFFNRLADRTVNLTEGQAYPYQFQFFEGGGGSGAFLRVLNPGPGGGIVDVPAAAYVSTQRGPVPAPSNLRGTNLDRTQATIVFDNENSTAQNYYITVTDPAGTTREFLTTPDGSPFTVTGLTANTTYTVRVRGYNVEGGLSPESTATFTTTATPSATAAPSFARIFPRAGGTVVVINDNSFNETGFVFERSVDGGAFVEAGRLPGSAAGVFGFQSFTDTATLAGQSLVYRIRATGEGGDSASVTSTAAVVPAPGTGVRKTSFDDIDFTGSDGVPDPVIESPVPDIEEDFGGGGPTAGLGPDQFSVIYDGFFQAEVTGSYMFGLSSDDGVSMLLINPVTGQPIINFNNLGARRGADFGNPQDILLPVQLQAGVKYPIEVRMVEDGGGAAVKIFQSVEGTPFQSVPTALLFPTDPSAPPAFAPTIQSASAFGSERITLNFTDFNFTETGFEIERGTSATGPFVPAGTAAAGANSATIAGPFTAGTPVFFRLRATGAGGGFSPYSNVVSVTPNNPATETRTDLTLGGTARFITVPADVDADGEALQLTDNVNDQTGTAFLTYARNVDRDFVSTFRFQIPEGNGADGFAFVLQSNSPTARGGGGGALGYAGIPNSLAVKFDIYNNINQTGIYVNGRMADDGSDIGFEIDNGHIYEVTLTFNVDGADEDGNGIPDPGTDNDAITVKIVDITDPTVTPFETTYSFDAAFGTFDLDTILGSDNAYIGFTGATGGLNAEQNILDFFINTQEIPLRAPTTTAQVTEVYVRGSAWNANFKTYLEAQGLGDDQLGYRVDNKPATDVAPWTNMNEIVLRYSAPPSAGGIPTPATVTVVGDRGQTYAVTAVNQINPQTFVLVLDRPLGNLSAGGENGVRVNLTVPLGGPGGANYVRRINALQGDVDKSGSVLANDYSAVKARFFQNPSTPNYSAFHDTDGSGSILANDYSAVKARFFDNLLAPAPLTGLAGGSITRDMFGSRRILG